MKSVGVYEINDKLNVDYKKACNMFQSVCNYFDTVIHGVSPFSDHKAAMLQKRIGITSASTKQLAHFAQLINKGKFVKFGYGYLTNKYKYGTFTPPEFDLQSISPNIPIGLLVGKNDTLANKIDVDRLAKELGNKVIMHKEYDQFDHFGFSIGKDMSWTQDVLQLLA